MAVRNYSVMFNSQFFSHVTNNVVVAVVEEDVGAPQVEEMLARITSWQVSALEKHMKVTLLACGRVVLREGGVAKHEPARPFSAPPLGTQTVHIMAEDVWTVFSVDPSETGRGRRLHLYAALNVGQEGWSVFTSDFHTLLHVLRGHRMRADHLTGQDSCVPACTGRRDTLVPRTRACLRNHPIGPVSFLRKYRLHWRDCETLALDMDTDPAHQMCEERLFHYFTEGDPEAGWVLLSGFDVRKRKHRAVGRTCLKEEPFEMVCEEHDVRKFLDDVKPVLSKCRQASRNYFLRNFVQINPVSWVEAAEMVSGRDRGLREAAFRQVCELPLEYLQQHAPHALYTAVTLTHAILPWTPEADLKRPEDIT